MYVFSFNPRSRVSLSTFAPLPATGMYDYAKQKGLIVDEDAYLESITER